MTPRRETPLDAAEIVRCLASHGVDYLMIGGLAVQAYGHVRTTQDADIVPAPDQANLARLATALKELAAHPTGGTTTSEEEFRLDAESIARAGILTLETDAGGMDIHTKPPGGRPYEELRDRALMLEVSGVEVAFTAKDDLIAMKLESRRPIDLGDIAALTESNAEPQDGA